MIQFKKNFEKLLPYSRKKYRAYLADDDDSSLKWYGASLQVPGITDAKDASFQEYVEVYEALFRNIVLEVDNGSPWIVSHDDKDLQWFPNDFDNLPNLRALFKVNDIPNSFKGALIFSTQDLLENGKELVSYPYTVMGKKDMLYKNLDISHSKLQAIIKISGHLNIDFLSTEQLIFRKIIHANFANRFVVKEYQDN